jgi:plasmid stabilization system protein ParE
VRLVVSRAVALDLERLHHFLAQSDAQLARRAIAAIDTAVQSLATFPERGRSSGIPGIRELIVPFGRSAYLLRYAYSARRDEIVILRIWHGREERA